MFNFVGLLKYKRQMTGNKLCKPAQRSGAGLRIICYDLAKISVPSMLHFDEKIKFHEFCSKYFLRNTTSFRQIL